MFLNVIKLSTLLVSEYNLMEIKAVIKSNASNIQIMCSNGNLKVFTNNGVLIIIINQ